MNHKVLHIDADDGDYGYSLSFHSQDKMIQIHRYNKGIDFLALDGALHNLSLPALALYVYLDKLPTTIPWGLKESVVLSKTQLTSDGYELALEELIRKRYLTPGEIHLNGKDYLTGIYHFWESPELNEGGHGFH